MLNSQESGLEPPSRNPLHVGAEVIETWRIYEAGYVSASDALERAIAAMEAASGNSLPGK